MHNFAIPAARLHAVSPVELELYFATTAGVEGPTTTMPDPKDPDQLPPESEVQLRRPDGVAPMPMSGASVMHMRKSKVSPGGGRERAGWGKRSFVSGAGDLWFD